MLLTETNRYNTWGNDDAVCPYCGHKHEDMWDRSMGSNDGDSDKMVCDSCDRTFIVTVNTSISYTTDCANGEHELVTDGKYQTVAKEECRYCQCKNCQYSEWCTDAEAEAEASVEVVPESDIV